MPTESLLLTLPVVAAALVAVMVAGVAALWWSRRRARVWAAVAARGRWLQITPPAALTPGSVEALWRLLATQLPADSWWRPVPARIAWEAHATGDQLRVGIWIPAGRSATAIRRAIDRAWPGALVTETRPPRIPPSGAGQATTGARLGRTGPEGLPLLHAGIADAVGRLRAPAGASGRAGGEDQLRAVYGGLASAGRTGPALLQVLISRAPAGRVAAARRAATGDLHATPRLNSGRGWPRLVAFGLHAVLRGAIEVIRPPGPARDAARRLPEEVRRAQRERARVAWTKADGGPHLLVCIRVQTCGPTREASAAAAAEVLAGFALLTTALRPQPWPSNQQSARERTARRGEPILATVAEVAALTGLPADPSLYGMPAPTARRRSAPHGVWTPPAPSPRAGGIP